MMTSSNGDIFRATGPLWGEFTGHRWIPLTKASDAELWCFLYLCLNKWLSKQSRRWWFETSSRPLYDAIVMNAPQQKRDDCAKFPPYAFWFLRQNHNTTTETRQPVYVIMVGADAMAPNRHWAIINHQCVTLQSLCVIRIVLLLLNKLTLRSREIGNPSVIYYWRGLLLTATTHHGILGLWGCLTFFSPWISNHMHIKVWCEITYPSPNFNGSLHCWSSGWTSNFTPHFNMHVITYPCWEKS